MINKILAAIFGTQHERDVKRMLPIVAEINALEPGVSALSDEELRGKTATFRERLKPVVEAVDAAKREIGLSEEAQAAHKVAKQDLQDALDALLPEAFAVCLDAGRRVLNIRHFDVLPLVVILC